MYPTLQLPNIVYSIYENFNLYNYSYITAITVEVAYETNIFLANSVRTKDNTFFKLMSQLQA